MEIGRSPKRPDGYKAMRTYNLKTELSEWLSSSVCLFRTNGGGYAAFRDAMLDCSFFAILYWITYYFVN